RPSGGHDGPPSTCCGAQGELRDRAVATVGVASTVQVPQHVTDGLGLVVLQRVTHLQAPSRVDLEVLEVRLVQTNRDDPARQFAAPHLEGADGVRDDEYHGGAHT